MGSSRRFDVALAWRTAGLVAAMALFFAAVSTPQVAAARIVAAVLVVLAIAALWSTVRQTNRDLARFVEALRFDDLSQRFSSAGSTDALSTALDTAIDTLRRSRLASAAEARFFAAALEDAPVALLAIADDGTVTALSKAARRLFGRKPLRQIEDFDFYGAELAAAVALPPGGRRVTRIVLDGVAQQVILATARVEWLGAGATIASLLPVQAEFSRIELAAQANLVRVLTHEIMNSLTPVISLARSGAELVADAAANDPSLRVAQNAVETLAARADGILRFVESYRDFAFSPELRRQHFAAKAWADQIAVVALADIQDGTAAVTVKVDPLHITVDGDPNLLAQVILNLIRNAVLAKARRVEVRVGWTQGKGVAIEVADDGPGIPLDRREDVFLPFYTTRRHGSGVGLSFARQIALAHGGSISAGDADLGGASILLSL